MLFSRRIDELRAQLTARVHDTKDLLHPDVLQLSQQLDQLILQHQQVIRSSDRHIPSEAVGVGSGSV